MRLMTCRASALQRAMPMCHMQWHVPAAARVAARPTGHAPAAARVASRPTRLIPAAAAPSDVFVLDFDGVICDSEKEVSSSAFNAATQHWPALFGGLSAEQVAAVRAGLTRTRPRLVEGYEAMVMARLIAESEDNIGRILADWEQLLHTTLAEWREDPATLQALFDRHRSARLAGNRSEWLACNPMFRGVAEALQDCPYPFYVASSKAASRLAVLLGEGAGLPELGVEGSPRVLASLLPPNTKKAEALRMVMSRPVAADAATTLHFVDDRYETLEYMCGQPDLAARWTLYLADWGYNTDEEKAAVARGALPGVRRLRLQQFCELLRFGIVMGVDDGCEPTPEEVLAGVYRAPEEE